MWVNASNLGKCACSSRFQSTRFSSAADRGSGWAFSGRSKRGRPARTLHVTGPKVRSGPVKCSNHLINLHLTSYYYGEGITDRPPVTRLVWACAASLPVGRCRGSQARRSQETARTVLMVTRIVAHQGESLQAKLCLFPRLIAAWV